MEQLEDMTMSAGEKEFLASAVLGAVFLTTPKFVWRKLAKLTQTVRWRKNICTRLVHLRPITLRC